MKRSHQSFTERATNVGPPQRKQQVLGVDYPQALLSCSGFTTCQEQHPLLHGQPGCLSVSTGKDTSNRWHQGNGGPNHSSVAAQGTHIGPLGPLGVNTRTQNTSIGLAPQAPERFHRSSQIPVSITWSGLDQPRGKKAFEFSVADPSIRSGLPSAQQQNQQPEQFSAHTHLAQRWQQPHLPQQVSHAWPLSEGHSPRFLEPPLLQQQAPPSLALAQRIDHTRPARALADSTSNVSFLTPGLMTLSLAPAPFDSAADLPAPKTHGPAMGFELLPQVSITSADAPSVMPSIGTWAAQSSSSILADSTLHVMQNGMGENVHQYSRLETYTVRYGSSTFHSGIGCWPNGDLGEADAREGRQGLPEAALTGPLCSKVHGRSCIPSLQPREPQFKYQLHPPSAPHCSETGKQRPQPQQERHQIQSGQPRQEPSSQEPPQPWQPSAQQPLQKPQPNVLPPDKRQQGDQCKRQQPQSHSQQQQHQAPVLSLTGQSQIAAAAPVVMPVPWMNSLSGGQRRLTASPRAAAVNGKARNSQDAHDAASLLGFSSGYSDGRCGNGVGESAQPIPSNVLPPSETLKRPLRMELSEWIPHAGIVAAFASKGVTKLYPWQAAALECGEDGHNLVYCAPTSGGKSLVAEILMIRRLVAAARTRQRSLLNGPQAATTSLFPRALLVLPYVSIVSEKAEHLTHVLAPLRGKVCGYSGVDHTTAPLSAPGEMVAVMTMEKANSSVNRMLAEGRLGELCCVVVDEAHMVGDPHRGICLELCLTKLRFAAAAAAAVHTTAPAPSHSATVATAISTHANPAPFSCQLICMSATMSGLDDMCGWLGARLFMTNFRPVPLTEYAVFKGKVFRKLTQRELEQKAASVQEPAPQQPVQQTELSEAAGDARVGTGATGSDFRSSVCSSAGMAATVPAGTKPNGGFTTAAVIAAVAGGLSPVVEPLVEERDLPESSPKDPDRVVMLVAEVAREGHSTLVFCATRNACQGCAGLLADLLPKQLPAVSPETFEARRTLLVELQDASGGYLSPELQKLIEAGVAYHHAGLTSQERAAVEKGFRGGLIHTLTATSTLAAGINLPARRVILRSLWQGIGPVSRAQYLQMIGRAGRAGQSPTGEAFLIGKGPPHTMQGEWRDVCRLMTARLLPLRCCLLDTPAAPSEDGAAPAHSGVSDGTAGGRVKHIAGADAAAAMPRRGVANTLATGKPALAIVQTVGDCAGPGADADPSALSEGPGLAKPGLSGGGAAVAAPAERGGETHLQRMLLEAIANGSVTTGATVEALIRSTLLYQQEGYGKIAAATHSALSALRHRRLVTFRPLTPKQAALPMAATAVPKDRPGRGPQTTALDALLAVVPSVGAGGGAGALWQPTQMGRAIYESCLPTAEGEDLYARLTRALDGLALEGGLHLLYLLMNEPLPVEITNWEVWGRMMERLPREPHLRVAEALGVTTAYAQRLASGRRGNLEESARHWRFASACLMHDIMCEGDPHELELAWGMPGGLTKNGISRGQLQKLQTDLSKWAGMAAVMAGSCGWWALQALLEGLSQQAAAGARPELLPLMVLPSMTGARARGLYAAGITRPTLLAVADEEDVKKALAASLPRALRQPKAGKGAKVQESALATAAAAASGNALLSRGARALVAAARQYLADLASRAAQEEADIAEVELGANGCNSGSPNKADRAAARRAALEATARLAAELQAARGCAGSQGGPANDAVCPTAPAAGVGAGGTAAGAPAAVSCRGSARITELSDDSSPEAVEAFIKAWRAQPCFSLAVISSTPLELDPEQRRLQQLHLGVVATAKGAASGTAGLQAADTDGSRPSAVDTAMIIPGPPGAAMSARQSQGQLMVSGQVPGRRKAIDGRVATRNGRDVLGDGRRGGVLGIIEGLVVAWGNTDAFLLTFHHQPPLFLEDGRTGAGGSRSGRDGNGVGLKRKADVQLGNSQKKGGPVLTTAAAAFRVGVSTVDDADMDLHNPPVGMGKDGNRTECGRQSALWLAACGVLGAPDSCKVCWHAEAQLAALMLAGCEPAGQWDDPRIMAWLAQGTTAPQDLTSQDLRRSLLPSYAVRVPLQHSAAATAACRLALISWALAAPLRAMLVAEGVASHYRLVEAPLTMALARTRINLKPPKAAHDLVLSADPSDTTFAAVGAAGPNGAAACTRHSSGVYGCGGMVLDEDACRAELSRVRASTAAYVRLISEYVHRPVDLSLPAAVDALCNREYLVMRSGGPLPPELHLGVTVGRRPPWYATFRCRAVALPLSQRIRSESVAQLLTSASSTSVRAIALESLLTAYSSVSVAKADSGSAILRGSGGDGQFAGQHRQPEQCEADLATSLELQRATEQAETVAEGPATSGHVSVATSIMIGVVNRGNGDGGCVGASSGAARFALQRLGVEGRLGCVFNGYDDCAYPAPDDLVLLTELSSAPAAALSLQQQYCNTHDAELYLQSLLPLPVLFLDTATTTSATRPSLNHKHRMPEPRALRPGLLLELQDSSPCMALSFGAAAQAQVNGSLTRCKIAVVAAADPLTRQPLRLALLTNHVWCARSCCGADQCLAAARAGQLLNMTMPQVLQCPAEEFLRPPTGWTFLTVLYPYLHLAVLAHCSGDEGLVEALYQPQPWAAVAAAWQESQADQLRRLLPQLHPVPGGAAVPAGSDITAPGGLVSPKPLELVARQVLSRALIEGCSHNELASVLGLTAGSGGGKLAAAALLSSFLEAFPGVARYRDDLLARAKKDGHVLLPSGQHLRLASRQLNAGGVAAGAKLQRMLCRMQLSAAAAEVVRTAAALAWQRIGRESSLPTLQSPPLVQGQPAVPVSATPGVPVAWAPAASLVWCDEARATLCVSQQRQKGALREVQDAASTGVMTHLGLRIPLHVSIYHGRSLDLLRCQQYIPGTEEI
ncbi:hypothetical protein VaNZ11_008967 [Volvox africanus]|uniref:DNA-directed DNA polymerase n=1 Tax=Volvox africanus TaxID=51714 RepID=A0ABQ5S6X0_9CHLO|nr:hypothetical protein VaNZ11_008967 [Volvox africanus]